MNHYYQSVDRNGKFSFKISAVLEEDFLNLTVFNDETAWKVKVSKDELIAQAKNHNMRFDEYYVNLRKYFDCHPKDLEFDFKSGKFGIKGMLKNKMRIFYFQSTLTKVEFTDSIFDLIGGLYNKKVEYFMELKNLQNQHDNLKNDYATMDKKLNEFLDRRNSEEQKLYNKFLAILNEKKRHIQHLNDLLIALRQGRPSINPPVQVKRKNSNRGSPKNKKIGKRAPETPSESSSDNDSNNIDYDTDETEQTNNNIPRETSNISPVASTSKVSEEAMPDSPTEPPFTFSKRIWGGNNIKMDIISHKKESDEDEQEELAGVNDNTKPKNEELPRVNFNTQDLLDNL